MSLFPSDIYFDFFQFQCALGFEMFFSFPHFPGAISAHITSFYCLIMSSLIPISLFWGLRITDTIKNSLTLWINVCLYCCSALQRNSSDIWAYIPHVAFVWHVSLFLLAGYIYAYFSGWFFFDHLLSVNGYSLLMVGSNIWLKIAWGGHRTGLRHLFLSFGVGLC